MTSEEFKTHMQKISKNVMELDDQNPDMPLMIEEAHIKADELMCEILTDLGYGEGIEIFKNMEKYYVLEYKIYCL
jgi:adenylate cyclase class IV